MNAAVQRTLEDKLNACADRVVQMRELLADLTADIGQLAGLITALSEDRGQEDVQTLLNLHQAEIIRLLAASQEMASAEPPRAGRERRAFPFRLDPIKREVRIGRRQVSLTPREFQVVELLWEQMPSAVSREAILERLYGTRKVRSERVIDVHIYNIRQKLQSAGATDATIHSKAGEGWRLDLHVPNKQQIARSTLKQLSR